MKKLFIAALIILTAGFVSAQEDAAKGKEIFSARCASCHNFKQDMTGPALKDIDKRRKPEWIIQFVQSSQAMISAGDPEAKAVFAKYQTVMPDHKDLSEADVKNIITFIKAESERLEKEAANNPIKRPKENPVKDLPLNFATDWWIFVVYGFFLFLLVYALLFVVRANDLTHKDEA